jgi:hypothetical protein
MDTPAPTTCGEVAAMAHSERVHVIEKCAAVEIARSQLATRLFSQTKTGQKCADVAEYQLMLEEWGQRNADLLSKKSVAVGLAARFAPDITPPTCPSTELPIRRYQLFEDDAPFGDDSNFNSYADWLGEAFSQGGLSRCAEFAWVRACEEGVFPEASHNRGDAFMDLMKNFDPLVETVLKAQLGRVPPDVDIEQVILEAWLSFYRAYIICNEHCFVNQNVAKGNKKLSRDRYAAVAPLAMVMAMFARRRLPKLGFTLTRLSVDEIMQEGVAIEILTRLALLVEEWFSSKRSLVNAMEKLIGKAQLVLIEDLVLKHVERRPRPLGVYNSNCDSRKPDHEDKQRGRLGQKTDHDERQCGSLINSILMNKLPNGSDLNAAAPKSILDANIDNIHWDGCKYAAKWDWPPRPLIRLEKARMFDYWIRATPANQIAHHDQITRAATSLSLFNAVRKMRCCLISCFDEGIRRQARDLLLRYVKETHKWDGDPDSYSENMGVLDEKSFPLPEGGLLGILLSNDEVARLCNTQTSFDPIAIEYHFYPYKVGELAKKHKDHDIIWARKTKMSAADCVIQHLKVHWLNIVYRIETLLGPNSNL